MHRQTICRFLISGVLILTPSAFAKTLYVGTCHAGSYGTISAAVAAATAGATIEVCPGNYPEQVFITEQLTLKGITSAGGDRARIVVPVNLAGGPTSWQFVTDPFQLVQAAPQIFVNSPATTPVVITNLTIDGTGEVGAIPCNNTGWWDTVGIYAWSSVTIDEVNTIGQGQTSCGIGIEAEQALAVSASSVTIENSSVLNPSLWGIYLLAPSPGLGMTVSVTNNTLEMNRPIPLVGTTGMFYAGITGKISSNTLLSAGVGIWDGAQNSSLTISSNTLASSVPSGGGGSGIFFPYSLTNAETYSDNKIVSFDYGINFLQPFAGTVTLKSNTIANSQTAIALDCNNPTLSSNTISNAVYGFEDVPSGFSTTGTSFYNVNQFVEFTCP